MASSVKKIISQVRRKPLPWSSFLVVFKWGDGDIFIPV
jgi:hypothetical protein